MHTQSNHNQLDSHHASLSSTEHQTPRHIDGQYGSQPRSLNFKFQPGVWGLKNFTPWVLGLPWGWGRTKTFVINFSFTPWVLALLGLPRGRTKTFVINFTKYIGHSFFCCFICLSSTSLSLLPGRSKMSHEVKSKHCMYKMFLSRCSIEAS